MPNTTLREATPTTSAPSSEAEMLSTSAQCPMPNYQKEFLS
ncbi:hypothetical protein [Nostoc sp.]